MAWILIWQALDEFGIEELKRSSSTNSPSEHLSEIEAVQAQVTDEALAGALRIAALTNVLSSNGYLRLDPNVMHFSVHQAGL